MSSAPNPNSPQPDNHIQTLTPDPLLKSGSFIATNNLSNGAPDSAGAGSSNGTEPETSKKRRRSVAADMAWLPTGWVVEDRVRSSGATAGTVDKYYFDPVSGRRFRSKKEVESFLATGSLHHKRKRGTKNSDTDTDSLEGSGGTKSKKSGTKAKASALKFDYLNVPEKITWLLTEVPDTSEESWTPFLNGDENVLASHRDEWAAAFESLTTKSRGHTKAFQSAPLKS